MASLSTFAPSITMAQGSLFQRLQAGIPMPKSALIALTLFPPTGIIGLNWAAVGNSTVAFMKVASYAVTSLTVLFMSQYSSLVSPRIISVVAILGPWFMFDVLQILSKEFDQQGFILPLESTAFPAGDGKEGKWSLTLPVASLILSTLFASGLVAANVIPAGILSNDFQKYISYASGGGSTIFATIGTVAGMMSTTSGGGGAPVATTTVEPMTMAPTQTGGGSSLPPLSLFIDQMISQNSKSAEESLAFFSILAIIVLGGFMTTVFKTRSE